MNQEKLISPTLQALKQQLENGNAKALEDFWDELDKKGSPIIEDINGDSENCMLTVVWQDNEGIQNVLVFGAVFGGPFGDEKERPELYKMLNTNLWYRTYIIRRDVHCLYFFGINVPEGTSNYNWDDMDKRLDQFNPKTFSYPRDEENPDDIPLLREVESLLELPDYEENKWGTERSNKDIGKITMHRFKSTILNNERRIWIYTPFGYDKSREEYPTAIFTDGWEYINMLNAKNTFDNMIIDSIIPAAVVIFIESLGDSRSTELCCYDPFNAFLTDELLPWVKENYRITNEQANTLIGGVSFGGLAAAYAGLRRPDIFGKILSQSGGFCMGPDGNIGDGWIIEQYKQIDKLPLKLYLDLGVYETFPPMRDSNMEITNVLKEKGYEVKFQWFPGAHSYEYWGDALPKGLIYLLGD